MYHIKKSSIWSTEIALWSMLYSAVSDSYRPIFDYLVNDTAPVVLDVGLVAYAALVALKVNPFVIFM